MIWLDENTRLFKLTFSRYGGKGCWKEHEQILQDYEDEIKRPYEGYSKARTALTSSLKSSIYFKMIKEIKDGYIFQFRSDLGTFLDDLNLTEAEVLETEDDPSENHIWTRDNILNLIECFRAHQDRMELPQSKKKNVWFSICEMLKEKGEEAITAEMCYSKWRNMKRTYTLNLEKSRQFPEGGQQPRWEYFDMFHDIYRGKRSCGEDSALIPRSSLPVITFVDPVPCNSYETTAEAPVEDSDQKERNATETIKRCLQEAHVKNCAQVKKLRVCVEQANRISSEKNYILKETLKERNLILKKYLGEKNDILRELLETRNSAG